MKLGAALAALTALAVGGSALASAAQHKSNTPAQVNVVQPTADTDTVQEGDQSAPDTAAESAGESASESASETGPSDGPGGYADTSPNADTQQEGEH
jgi:hypothetical protein